VGSERIDEPWVGWLVGEYWRIIDRLLCWKWLVVFYFSFMKDDGSDKLDGNGINCSGSVFQSDFG